MKTYYVNKETLKLLRQRPADAACNDEQWNQYLERLERWATTEYADLMHRFMSLPNKPGYWRANND